MAVGFSRDMWYNYIADRSHPPVASAVIEKPEYDPDHIYAWKPAENYKGWKLIAKGEAGVDDVNIIQEAIDYVNSTVETKGTVVFRPGIHTIKSSIILRPKVSIIGYGAKIVHGDNGAFPMMTGYATGVVYAGFELDGNQDNVPDGSHRNDNAGIRNHGGTFANCIFKDLYIHDIKSGAALVLGGVPQNCIIENVIIKDCGLNTDFASDGIWNTGSNMIFKNCIIDNVTDTGIANDYGGKRLIENCIITNAKEGAFTAYGDGADVEVCGGYYHGINRAFYITNGSPKLTIRSATIEGDFSPSSGSLVVKDSEITGSYASGGADIRFENVYAPNLFLRPSGGVTEIKGSTLYIIGAESDVEKLIVEDSVIDAKGNDVEAIYTKVETVIKNCRILNAGRRGVLVYGTATKYILFNIFVNCNVGVAEASGADNTKVYNNLFHNCSTTVSLVGGNSTEGNNTSIS